MGDANVLGINECVLQCHIDSLRWFPDLDHSGLHHLVGLIGEVGEVANIVKKIDRGSMSLKDFETQEALASELADVLTYVANLADVYDIDLEEAYVRKREFNERRFGPGARSGSGTSE